MRKPAAPTPAAAPAEPWRFALGINAARELSDIAGLLIRMTHAGDDFSPDLLRGFAVRLEDLAGVFTGALDPEWTEADTAKLLYGTAFATDLAQRAGEGAGG